MNPSQARSGPPGLDELLAALRAEGLAIGPRELTRLHQAFAAAQRLGVVAVAIVAGALLYLLLTPADIEPLPPPPLPAEPPVQIPEQPEQHGLSA